MKINHIIDEAVSGKFLNPQAVAQDPGLEREKDVDVIIFGRMPQDFTFLEVVQALEDVLPREYPPGSSQNTQGVPISPAERIASKIAEHAGAVVTTKPLSIAQKVVKEFQARGIKCTIDQSGLGEDITRRGFLQGAGAAAVAGAAGGAMAGARDDAIESITKLAGTIWDMRRVGYSRSSAVTTLEKDFKFTGEALRVGTLICDFAWSIPKDHFTRNEFVQQVRVQLYNNLPPDSKSIPTPKKPEVKSTQKIQQSQPVQKNNIPQDKIRNWEPEQKQNNSTSGQSIGRESIEHSIAEGKPSLPDRHDFESDWDYQNALDAYGKPPADDWYDDAPEPDPDAWMGETKDKVGNMDADAFDAALSRMKKLAGAGPLRTVYDPNKRVYKNVPHAVQPAQQPKKAR